MSNRMLDLEQLPFILSTTLLVYLLDYPLVYISSIPQKSRRFGSDNSPEVSLKGVKSGMAYHS